MIRLLLTSGRGPAECRIALTNALKVLRDEAGARGLDVDVIAGTVPDTYGPVSAIVNLHGEGAETFAREWTGSIKWVAQSRVRPHHKRKNWFIGVFKLPPIPEVTEKIAPGDVRFETFAAGGPGGQHQNKTESAVRAVHIPTGLTVVARDERSQHRNKALALSRIAAILKQSKDLAEITDQKNAHLSHDQLERGQPVKVFKGDRFQPA